MKQKQILGLGAAAVVLMGLAVYLSESRKPAEEAPVNPLDGEAPVSDGAADGAAGARLRGTCPTPQAAT